MSRSLRRPRRGGLFAGLGALPEVEVDQVLARDAGLFAQDLEVQDRLREDKANTSQSARALTGSDPIGRIARCLATQ